MAHFIPHFVSVFNDYQEWETCMITCNNQSSLPGFIHICLEIDIYDIFFPSANEFYFFKRMIVFEASLSNM